jgi:hypothetical protein
VPAVRYLVVLYYQPHKMNPSASGSGGLDKRRRELEEVK